MKRSALTPALVVTVLALTVVVVALCTPTPAHAACGDPPCEITHPPVYYIELDVEPDWYVYSAGDVVMLLIDGSPFVPARATRWFVVPRADPNAGFYQGAYANAGWCANFYVQEGCYVEAGPW